nr:hypothetical protein [Kofleriaceae bacterium]
MAERRDGIEGKQLVVQRALAAGRLTSVLLMAVLVGIPSVLAAVIITHKDSFVPLFFGGLVVGTAAMGIGMKLVLSTVAARRRRALFAIGWGFDAGSFIENLAGEHRHVVVVLRATLATPSDAHVAVPGFACQVAGDTVVLRQVAPVYRIATVLPLLHAAGALAKLDATHAIAKLSVELAHP